MRHYQDFVAHGTPVEAATDPSRHLRLSQTLAIALLLAIVTFVTMAANGTSWFGSAMAAIAMLNIVPLLLGLMLSALR